MRFSTSRAAKLIPQLKELRIHLCQTSTESQGVRDYIQKNYVQLKKDNPALPILIRECSGVQPKLWARFELGKETCVPLTNQSAADIATQIDAVGK